MMISTKTNSAFLAMPRTASTSIEAALLPFADIAFKGYPRFKHINLSIFNLRLRPFLEANNFGSIETIAIFREPISWLASWYRYRASPDIRFRQNSTAGVTFNEFVEAYLMEERPDFAKVGQQRRFVKDKTSDCGIDHLFKFENLTGFKEFMSDRFLSEFDFVPSNASVDRDLGLSPDLKKQLVDYFAKDYEIYEKFAR